MPIVDAKISAYTDAHSSPLPQLLNDLVQETELTQEGAWMLSGHVQGRLLKMLVGLSRAKVVVELGMFTGYSALSMAEGLPPEGRVICCEINPNIAKFAQRYYDRSPHGHKIEVQIGHALALVQALNEPIDFAYIDADKRSYPDYYEAVLAKLNAGGLIALDNTLLSGKVLIPAEDEDGYHLDQFNKRLAADERVEVVLLPMRDGMTLVRKK